MAAMAAARVESPRLLSFSLLGPGKLQGLEGILGPGNIAPSFLGDSRPGTPFARPAVRSPARRQPPDSS